MAVGRQSHLKHSRSAKRNDSFVWQTHTEDLEWSTAQLTPLEIIPMKTLPVILLLLTYLIGQGLGESGFNMDSITLYQEENVLKVRAGEIEKFGDFVKQIEATCSEFFAKADRPESLSVVVAVKPGKQSRVWFVSSTRKDQKDLDPLRKKLEAISAIAVNYGPVVFAVNGLIGGGDGKKTEAEDKPNLPIPLEWKEAAKSAKKEIAIPDGFLELVWPDTDEDKKLKNSPEAPDGFVYQQLDPLGGKSLRPKGWFFTSKHNRSNFMWTFSKEDLAKTDSYTTGVRIQLVLGVRTAAKQSPKDFIRDFVTKKTKSADKVHKTCDAVQQNIFTRMCLETEEGPHRILYSFFWSDELDMIIISTAGTTLELWDKYTETFDKMNGFEPFKVEELERFLEQKPEQKKPSENETTGDKNQ